MNPAEQNRLEATEAVLRKESAEFQIGKVALKMEVSETLEAQNKIIESNSVFLQSESGEQFDISNLLPKDWKIIFDDAARDDAARLLDGAVKFRKSFITEEELRIPPEQALPEPYAQVRDTIWGPDE